MTIESGKVTLYEALEWAIGQALSLYEPVHVGDLPDADISPQGQVSTTLTTKAYRQLQRIIAHRILADDNPHSISETCHAILAYALSRYEKNPTER